MTAVVPKLGERKSIADEIADTLRRLIITGQLTPDDVLNQSQLASQLNASTTPVREALLRLSAEGFIKARPNRAFQVVRMSVQDIEDDFAFHGLVAAELARRTLREDGERLARELAEIHARFEQARTDGDIARVSEENWAFHLRLHDASDSARLRWLLRQLRVTPSGVYRDVEDWSSELDHAHRRIMEAAAALEEERLVEAVKEHLAATKDEFLRYLGNAGYWGSAPQPPVHAVEADDHAWGESSLGAASRTA